MSTSLRATAFAPATIGNVAVGFDLLGLALDIAGDKITVEKIRGSNVEILSIKGVETALPTVASTNTAGAALLALQNKLELSHGFRISIEKGIPLGSGMGGSAASAVAAVVAANALLEQPLSKEELLEFAVAGETVASGSYHVDNVAPCLFGGLTLATPTRISTPTTYQITNIPFNKNHFIVLLHPHIIVETKAARSILKPTLTLSQHVLQSSFLAGFISACFSSNEFMMGQCLRDTLIEPQRAELIPGFYEIQKGAMEAGALGCSISGAGPSIFAWARNCSEAEKIQHAMKSIYKKSKIPHDCWLSPISTTGARILDVDPPASEGLYP